MLKSHKQEALKYLQDHNYLEYGKVIPSEVFEIILKMKCQDSWAFLSPFLEMKCLIEEEGFLCTTSCMELGCLRIYQTHEIADKADRIFNNVNKRLSRLRLCLVNTRTEEFNTSDARAHLHAANKITCSLHAMNSALNSLQF